GGRALTDLLALGLQRGCALARGVALGHQRGDLGGGVLGLLAQPSDLLARVVALVLLHALGGLVERRGELGVTVAPGGGDLALRGVALVLERVRLLLVLVG